MADFSKITRHRFNGLLALGASGLALAGCAGGAATATVAGSDQDAGDWPSADLIWAMTRVPVFPDREFPVEDFGAVGVGATDCTEAIASAINACHRAGGGRVSLATGVYRSGPIHLLGNVNLHVEAGAEISFIPEPARYLPPVLTRWEGMELMGFSPLIYAHGQTGVAVTGGGLLNGNADADTWWPWKGGDGDDHWRLIAGQDQRFARDQLHRMVSSGVPVEHRVFADGGYLRPPFIQFYDCREVLIEAVTITAAPCWLINPVLCSDVTVRGVTCASHGPNSDGRRIGVPSENILIQDCVMRAGHGGIVIGSEISGGVRNVHARDCVMSSPDLERAIRIKTNAARGGVIEHLRYSNIRVGEVQDAIVVNYYYEEGEAGEFPPVVRDVEIRGLFVDNAERVFVLRGFPDDPVSGLKIDGLEVVSAGDLGVIENVTGLHLTDARVNGRSLRPADLGLRI